MPSVVHANDSHVLQIKWHDRVSNQEVTSQTGLSSIWNIISYRRLDLFGHVAGLDSGVPTRDAQECVLPRRTDMLSVGLEKTTWTSKAEAYLLMSA